MKNSSIQMNIAKKLDSSFYGGSDVVGIALSLIGKQVVTHFSGQLTAGIITETEAYAGVNDKASHAYGGRNTQRTGIMYGPPGHAYIYLCYGIHSLFNVVTNAEGIPHAVLIRAMYPTKGIELMIKRRGNLKHKPGSLCKGPGTVSMALGIHYSQTGKSLESKELWIEDVGLKIPAKLIETGARIGVDYAGEDALLPYRFRIFHSHISKLIETGE